MKTKTASGYRLIVGYWGIFIAFIGGICLLPLAILPFFPSEGRSWLSFFIPGVIAIAIGLSLFFSLVFKAEKGQMQKHQDSLLLVLIWLSAIAIGAFPFFLSGIIDPNAFSSSTHQAYSYSEAFFESVSGYGTCGLSIFRDYLDQPLSAYCPHIFLFYRSLTQFFGGVGLVLIVASAFSDRFGIKLYYAEGHNDRLLPNLAKSAKLILSIYTGYIILGSFSLWLCGLDWFEALNHSIAALATGGFSTRSTSIAYFIDGVNQYSGNGIFSFNALGTEAVLCVLMILGATSFVLHMHLLMGKWKKVFMDCEIRMFFFLFLIGTSLMTIGIFNQWGGSTAISLPKAIEISVFQFVSCLTTTGFSNVANLVFLGNAAIFISVIAMSIGGGMGSTAGAIKEYRLVVIVKEIYWDLKYRLAPSRMIYPKTIIRAGETKEIDEAEYRSVSLYVALYVGLLLLGSLALSFLPGINFQDGVFEFASGLSETGTSVIDILGYKASFGTASYNALLWILSFAMFVGRFEITPVYFAAYRGVRDLFHKETV